MTHYESLADISLLELLNKGDEDAYTEIYIRYSKSLFMHAFKRLRNEYAAEDIIQDLFLKIWQKHDSLSISNLKDYLFGSVKYGIITFISKQKKDSELISNLPFYIDEKENKTDHLTRSNQFNNIIDQEIESLQPNLRAVMQLKRKGIWTNKEIGELLDIPKETVKTRTKTARKKLYGKLPLIVWIFYFLRL